LKRRTILVSGFALVVLAFFLLDTITSESMENSGVGPSVVTDVALLITVVLCVLIGFWVSFVDKKVENWKGVFLVVGLIFGSMVFLFSTIAESVGLPVDQLYYPDLYDNLIMAGDFLFAIAVILGLSAIAAVILILDRYFTEVDLKAEMKRHRLPTEDSARSEAGYSA
jgi:hypothetical protein